MAIKINFTDYEKCYPSRLKKFFRSNFNYKTYDEFIPNMKNQIVGNFPPEIINLFGVNKSENIKQFQQAMGEFVQYLRQCYIEFKKNNIIQFNFTDMDSEDLKLFEKKSSEFLNSMLKNIVPKGIKAKLEYVGKGGWKNVFKFSMYDYGEKIMHDKALQIFYNISCPVKSLRNSQGIYAETNFWVYLKNIIGHNMDKTQFTKYYMSDLKNGYSMTEFADSDITVTSAPFDFENIARIFYTDTTNEPINGKIYDVGGCLKFPGFIKDKVVLKYFKKLMYRTPGKDLTDYTERLKLLIQNPKTPHRDKIKQALELFQKEKSIDNYVI